MSTEDKKRTALKPGAFLGVGCMWLLIGMAQDGPLQVVMPVVGTLLILVALIAQIRVLRDRKQREVPREESSLPVMPR
ncbi:hypothetical protein [Cellulomonas sp. NPDC089187]|uniref:hypothetical protein n=1 Tax=Cellulomonas sp. NPDC089187 TaxID=3154970 RepID=UPI00342E4C4B